MITAQQGNAMKQFTLKEDAKAPEASKPLSPLEKLNLIAKYYGPKALGGQMQSAVGGTAAGEAVGGAAGLAALA